MKHLNIASISIGFGMLVLTAAPALSQDSIDVPGPQVDTRTTPESEAPKIEVHIQVSTMDGRSLPANSKVEISGREKSCGVLGDNDAFATISAHGEAIFKEIPACKVTIKINVNRYVTLRKEVDLATYKVPIPLILEAEQ